MFDIGFWELIVIAVLTLIVVGPQRLPEVLQTIGRWRNNLQRLFSQLNQDLQHDIKYDLLHDNLKRLEDLQRDPTKPIPEELKQALAQLEAAALSVQSPYRKTPATPDSPVVDEKSINPAPVIETEQPNKNSTSPKGNV